MGEGRRALVLEQVLGEPVLVSVDRRALVPAWEVVAQTLEEVDKRAPVEVLVEVDKRALVPAWEVVAQRLEVVDKRAPVEVLGELVLVSVEVDRRALVLA